MAVARYLCACALAAVPLLAQTDAITRVKELNGVLRQQAGDRKKSGVRAAEQQDLTPLLQERATLLDRLIRTNPKTAATLTLPAADAAELRTTGVDPKLIETPTSLYGAAESIVLDTADWTDSSMLYRMTTPDGPIEVYAASDVAVPSTCGNEIHVEGLRVGASMLATYVSVGRGLAPGTTCLPTGEQKIGVFMVNFPDFKHTLTKADMEQVYFDPGFQSIFNHTAENSAGAASVSGQVFGPYTLDRNYFCTETSALRQAVINAADADVDWTQFQHIHIVVPTLPGGCGWAGLGSVGCSNLTAPHGKSFRAAYAWIVSGRTQNELRRVATHELGHNYGVGHARTMFFPNSALDPDRTMATYVEYGDPFSLMAAGAAGIQNHFAAQHKAKFGWLKEGETYTVVDAPGTFQIAPAEVTDGRVRALKVKRNLNSGESIWVEYRQPIGMFDKDIPGNYKGVFNGALLRYEGPGTGLYSELLNMNVVTTPGTGVPANDALLGNVAVPEGAVWQDPFSDLTLQVKSVTPDAITVDIRYDDRCANFTGPALPVPADQQFLNIAVTAPANCFWNALSNNFWLATTSRATGSAPAAFTIAPAGDFNRNGSITVGRRTSFIKQTGIPHAPSIDYVSPTSSKLPVDRYVFHEIGVQDANGVEDLADIEVRWSDSDGKLCGLKYDFPTDFLFVLGDNGNYQPEPLTSASLRAQSNAQCFVAPSFGASRISATETAFWFSVQMRSTWAGDRGVSIRLTDAGGLGGDWQTVKTDTVTPGCFASTNFGTAQLPPDSGSQTISVQAAGSCDWQFSTSADWLKFTPSSGTGANSNIKMTFTENTTDSPRRADVAIGDSTVSIVQFQHGFAPTDAILQPGEAKVAAEGGRGQVTVNAESLDVYWTPVPDAPWITITRTIDAGGITDGSFFYRVAANPSAEPRQGTVTVAGRTFGIYQAGSAQGKPLNEFDGIQNGASFANGIAANSWVTIKGFNLSKKTRIWTGADFNNDNLPTSLDNVRVNINGLPAYVYYISSTQLNVLAPAGISTGSMNVEVIVNGESSGIVTVNSASISPALFTFDAEDHRYAAAVLQDGTYVGKPGLFGAALTTRPAKPGEFVLLFATGLGQTEPAYPDGKIPAGVLKLRSNVLVQFGGRASGTFTAAYLISPGLYQINVQIPANQPDGDTALVINPGTASPTVYLTVKK